MDLLGGFDTIVDLVGLLTSLLVLRQLGEMRRQYLRQARGPALLKRLSELEGDLSKLLLPSSLDAEQLSVVFASSAALLSNLASKLSGDELKLTKSVIKRLKDQRAKPIDRTATLELRAGLVSVINAVSEHYNDTQWIR
jgi:hypothetical protein